MSFKTTFLMSCVAGILMSAPAFAADTSLYPEAAPVDASFVRFVGFDGQDTATFAGKSFSLPAEEEFAYVPVSSALLEDTPAGSFVTVVHTPDGTMQTITEAGRTQNAKVFLILVNATDKELELRLADGSVAVIEGVASMEANQRGVNPVAIELGVFAKDDPTPLATFDVALRRGQNLSFIAEPNGVRLVENSFAAVAN